MVAVIPIINPKLVTDLKVGDLIYWKYKNEKGDIRHRYAIVTKITDTDKTTPRIRVRGYWNDTVARARDGGTYSWIELKQVFRIPPAIDILNRLKSRLGQSK